MKRILVIEDDAAVRSLIVETVEFKGWQALKAADGEEGWELAQREPLDLILCDIQMPKLDGYEVLRNVRENPKTAAVPFVFLTGLGDKPKMRQAMEAGADDYLVKPFTIHELIAAVEARLQKQAVFQESADRKLHELRESLSFALPHELVTPLNTILGFASLLLDSPSVGRDELKEYASHIRSAGQRLRLLIEKFLLYAQVELIARDPLEKKLHQERAAAPVKDVILHTASRAARENEREEDLQLELVELDHRISPSHLERLLRELLENAFKFSTRGTPVNVISSGIGGVFKVEVLDSGVGFTPDQLNRLGANLQFDRQIHEQQGTGLGLAIARRLAELYGGDLRINSVPGERTRVAVELPT